MIGFLQALGLMAYCSLVGILFWKGNEIFGKVPNYWGPFLFLIIFTTSALVSALITLGYPVKLFFDEKRTDQALKLIFYTACWLVFFAVLLMVIIFLLK